MKELFIFLSFALLFGSCKKFEHQEIQEIPECTYCHLADSIEGSYTGRLVERIYISPMPPQYDTILDITITVSVERTYEGLNYYEDSTVFSFNSTHFYDKIFLTEKSIQKGEYLPYNNGTKQRFTEDNKMVYRRQDSFDHGPFGGVHYYTGYEFIGEKVE